MGRKPKGKALTLRPIRLDDDVWAECQRLGKEHGTINEGLRARLVVVGLASEAVRGPIERVEARAALGYKQRRGPRPKGDKQR